jgi:hypothetical protein
MTPAQRKRLSDARWRARNPEYQKARCAAWREKNADKAKAYRQAWLAKNPEYQRARCAKYRVEQKQLRKRNGNT